ncbi:MAG: biotin/lipoyl-binding protein, partial [Treponema sp.]|nr:biotin/lipoyl-binding protein [Treponema sp.]
MKKKFIPPLILLVLLLGIGFYFFFSRGGSRGLVLRGVVEGTTYSQIAELPGKITEMNLTLGAPVKAGDPVARLDSRDQQYALEQQQIALAKGRLALRILQKGARQEELQKARNDVSIAEANYRSAQATYNQARDDVEALPALVEAGGLAQNALDQANLRKNTAAGALEAAKSQADKAREQLA